MFNADWRLSHFLSENGLKFIEISSSRRRAMNNQQQRQLVALIIRVQLIN